MKKETENHEIPSNFSFMFYEHPIYSSNTIYGIEDEKNDEPKEEKKEAADEPIESWGWVNNVD